MKNENKVIRHGELILLPVESADMSGAVAKKDYVASHSETGHHHVVQGNCMVLEREGSDTLMQIDNDTDIVHTKTSDRHKNLKVGKGIYRLLKKKEYDPFGKAMREVWD